MGDAGNILKKYSAECTKRMWLRCVMHNYVQMMNMGTGQNV